MAFNWMKESNGFKKPISENDISGKNFNKIDRKVIFQSNNLAPDSLRIGELPFENSKSITAYEFVENMGHKKEQHLFMYNPFSLSNYGIDPYLYDYET